MSHALFLSQTNLILQEYKSTLAKRSNLYLVLYSNIELLFTFGLASLLLISGICNYRLIVIIESILLFLIAFGNLFLFYREFIKTSQEVYTRLSTLLLKLQHPPIPDPRNSIPHNIPTIAVASVFRDDQFFTMPHALLCQGDIILLSIGERAPGKLACVAPPNDKSTTTFPEYILEKDIILDQATAAKFPYKLVNGKMHFKLLETPLLSSLKSVLENHRPETVVIWKLKTVNKILVSSVISIVLVISFTVNLARYLIRALKDPSTQYFGFTFLIDYQVYISIIVLPLFVPFMCLIARSYGNAQLLTLLEVLQNSNIQYKDEIDVDEFDAAPPPTKDISTSWSIFF